MEAKDVRHIRNLVSRNGDRVGSAMPRNIVTEPKRANAGPACSICGDTGWKIVQHGQGKHASRCECAIRQRVQRLIEQAHIPTRYAGCDFDSYQVEGEQSRAASAKL